MFVLLFVETFILHLHYDFIPVLKTFETSSIHNWNILFLIIMKDEGPNFLSFDSVLDILKNNTSSTTASEGIIFVKSKILKKLKLYIGNIANLLGFRFGT